MCEREEFHMGGRRKKNAQNELYLSFAQKETYVTESFHGTQKHTRNICILYTLIPSILYSYANVALSVCLFYAGPNVLLYPMEYYILKEEDKNIYIYIYNIHIYICTRKL